VSPEAPSHASPADVYDEDGVDRSLIRWMLSLTPTERLDKAQEAIDLVASVGPSRDGAR
jgi:hypothetical protein